MGYIKNLVIDIMNEERRGMCEHCGKKLEADDAQYYHDGYILCTECEEEVVLEAEGENPE